MIFSGLFLLGEIPFTDVIITSTVLRRRRPADVEEPRHRASTRSRRSRKHGADATRYGLLKISSTQDVRFSWGAIEEGRKLANKLWNVARLMLSNAARASSPSCGRETLEERWILARIDETRASRSRSALAPRSSSSRVVDALYHLTFDDFCDWYAEAIKPRLYDGDEDALATALAALERLLALLHPVMPHVTEEIWSQFRPRVAADRRRRGRRGDRRGHAGVRPGALERVQEAARTFRRSGVRSRLEGEEKRIFDAVVRPERAKANGDAGGRERAAAQGDRARRGDARERALRRERAAPRWSRRSARSSSATAVSSRRSSRRWLESLSPWPEEFGLGRMRALLAELGEPQRAFPAVHVVGTNGKSTATHDDRRAAARGGAARRRVHLAARRGWGSGSRSTPRRFDAALARVRPARGARRRDPVRGADGGGARRVRGGGGRRGRRRGGARRAARRDERARRAGRRADERRARAHGRARRDARGDRAREARGRAARRDGGARRARVGAARARAAPRVRRAAGAPRGRRRRSSGGRSTGEVRGRAARPARASHGDEVWDGAHNLAGVD